MVFDRGSGRIPSTGFKGFGLEAGQLQDSTKFTFKGE